MNRKFIHKGNPLVILLAFTSLIMGNSLELTAKMVPLTEGRRNIFKGVLSRY